MASFSSIAEAIGFHGEASIRRESQVIISDEFDPSACFAGGVDPIVHRNRTIVCDSRTVCGKEEVLRRGVASDCDIPRP